MGWMDDAMVELRPWIGRVRITEDDIGLMAVRRVAARVIFQWSLKSYRSASS